MQGPVFDDDVTDVPAAHDDLIDVGRAPRAPLPPHRRRWLVGMAAAVVLAAAVAVAVVQTGSGIPRAANSAAPTTTPPVASTTIAGSGDVNGGGPELVVIDGKDELSVLGGGPFGSSPQYAELVTDAGLVTAIQDHLPGFEPAAGGRVSDPNVHYGIFITGHFPDARGIAATLTMYSLRAPGTTPGTDRLVTRVMYDGKPFTRTEVSSFTGTGWWVHVLSLAEVTDVPAPDEVPTLLGLADDPRLIG